MKSSMTSIRVIYVHREREKVDFKSRELNCLKECALALTQCHNATVHDVTEKEDWNWCKKCYVTCVL